MPEGEVQRLWDEHRSAPFPHRLGGEEIAGVEMVMLDADVAGCVATWLDNKGRLDDERRAVLEKRLNDLDRVLSVLEDHGEQKYYKRRRRLAQLATGSG